MICCVRRAILTESSLGSASASSRELVCSDCVPPSTAASACSVTLTMLLSGCCAVRVEPAVCVWNLSCIDLRSLAPNLSFMILAHRRLAALNLATSSSMSLWLLKKNDSLGAKSSTFSPALMAAST